jgi:AcrR family transcriptional regulator
MPQSRKDAAPPARVAKQVRVPVQERAIQSVDSIVAAAALVLEERGLPGFNTKVVANHAGVNVATLYQYFENKQAVLTELFRRSERRRAGFLAGLLEQFAATDDWEPVVRDALAGLVAARRGEQGAAALRRALAASPDLQSLHRDSLRRDALAIRSMLLVRRPGLEPERAQAIGELFAFCTDAVLDAACAKPEIDETLVDQLRAMMIDHLRVVMAQH